MPNSTRNNTYASKASATSSSRGAASTPAGVSNASSGQTQRSSPPPSQTPVGHSARDAMDTSTVPGDVAAEFAKLTALILATSEAHEKKLEEIGVTTRATDNKLTEMANRISEVERRVVTLEETVDDLRARPATSSAEMEALILKLDDIENRERRLNLRFVGFPPHCEQGDVITFLCDTLPTLLDVEFPHGLEFQRAHRTGPERNAREGGDLDQPTPGRTIIARFLRYQDRNLVVDAARKKKDIIWNDHRIMVFADYSKLVNEKRMKFKECKKSLRDLDMRYFLEYPAVLVIRTQHGKRRFEDPSKAMEYIRSLE